jgi:hypothetical protein
MRSTPEQRAAISIVIVCIAIVLVAYFFGGFR